MHPFRLPVHPTLRHPLTGAPLRALGRRRDGRLIWPVLGGDETAGTGEGGTGDGDAAGTGTGATGGQGTAGSGQQTSTDGQQQTAQAAAEKVEDLPEWAQKVIRETRGEAAANRTAKAAAEKARQDTLDGIAKALGLKKDEEVTAAQLAEKLTATETTARQSQVELAVFKSAAKHGADADALLDSRGFLAKLADLDPTAKDFADKVASTIKDAVKENPKLKAARAAGASSADHAGGSGEQRNRTPRPLADAVASHYAGN